MNFNAVVQRPPGLLDVLPRACGPILGAPASRPVSSYWHQRCLVEALDEALARATAAIMILEDRNLAIRRAVEQAMERLELDRARG